jgi:arylsulfatase A-like enzyme
MPMRIGITGFLVVAVLCAMGAAQQPVRSPDPRMLIISIDGARPDLLLRANAATVRSLLPQASYTFWARTVPHAITLPSHASMLTGVVPRKHEIEWNKDLPLKEPVYPKFPTLFELAHSAGLTTAMAAGKSKIAALAKPGTVDWAFVPETEKCEDDEVAAAAIKIVGQHRPQVMFVHLPSVDNIGHASGWGSREQIAAIERADVAVGQLLKALEEAGVRDSTIILITSDHGGSGLTHLAGDPRAEFIPWIISGPGIRRDLDLAIYPKTTVTTMDTFATACRLLRLTHAPDVDGKPIIEALDVPAELIKDR